MNTNVHIPVAVDGDSRGAQAFLARVGDRVRAARTARGLSRKALSERSDVSQRYLAQLEAGDGNISIALLRRVAEALDQPVEWFVGEHGPGGVEFAELAALYARSSPGRRAEALAALRAPDPRADARGGRIALIGLRGAGKSTLGRMVAARLGLPFQELNARIEDASGMPVNELIALYGQEGYRRLERQALDEIADEQDRLVLAVAGGIVSETDTFDLLLSRYHTIWLKAEPEEHMARVRAQGDLRPMAGNPAAMDELKSILRSREALYARAPVHLDTAGRTLDRSLEDLAAAISRLGFAG
ncbi:MAG: helix-turn-helix transcriptional regulator [Rhizobiaceae bacterium]|nr:helix-turn-helix transcriptional regulator [Rhizobiaceae bacterium]MCV0404807.1 helix-turn-helix transcriptional regulator [Rhizobiaceae bacterium]